MKIFLAGGNGKNQIIQKVHVEGISCRNAKQSLDITVSFGGGQCLDEDLSGREHPFSGLYRSDVIRRGGSLDNESVLGKSTYNTEIPRRKESDLEFNRGWFP